MILILQKKSRPPAAFLAPAPQVVGTVKDDSSTRPAPVVFVAFPSGIGVSVNLVCVFLELVLVLLSGLGEVAMSGLAHGSAQLLCCVLQGLPVLR